MSRYDKYDPISGGFRCPLAAQWTGSETPLGVGLDTNGRVVPGAGTTGVIGVVINTRTKAALAHVDVMTSGHIVEFGGDPGTVYTVNTTTGAISTAAASATQVAIGFTDYNGDLVVRAVPVGFIG